MTYSYSVSFGDGIILAPCLQVLCSEIAAHDDYKHVTNLGEIGDIRHKGEGMGSDHNPFIEHDGHRYIRAIDLGGDRDRLLRLRKELHKLYVGRDPRLYPFGYFKGPDSQISDWPPGTGFHIDTGDEGHLHISVTQENGRSPSPDGWVRSLDSRAPWGLLDTPADPLEEVMAMYDSKAEFEAAVVRLAERGARKAVREEGNKGFNVRYLINGNGKRWQSIETYLAGSKAGYVPVAVRAIRAAAAKKAGK